MICFLFFSQQPRFSPSNELLIQLEIEKAMRIIFQMECEDIFMDWCWKNPKCLNICLQERCFYPLRILNRGLRKKEIYVKTETLMQFLNCPVLPCKAIQGNLLLDKTNAFSPESESYHKTDVQLVSAVA